MSKEMTTLLTVAGLIIAALGATLGVVGAWWTASNETTERHIGFICWVINSPLLILSFSGVYLGWWEPISVICFIPMQVIYWCTATRGWRNTIPIVVQRQVVT